MTTGVMPVSYSDGYGHGCGYGYGYGDGYDGNGYYSNGTGYG